MYEEFAHILSFSVFWQSSGQRTTVRLYNCSFHIHFIASSVVAIYIQPNATFGLSDLLPSIVRGVIEWTKVAFKGWIYIVLCTAFSHAAGSGDIDGQNPECA